MKTRKRTDLTLVSTDDILAELETRFDCMVFVGEVEKRTGKDEYHVPYVRKAVGPMSWILGAWARMRDAIRKIDVDGR